MSDEEWIRLHRKKRTMRVTDPIRRTKLHRLIVAGCTLAQIAKGLDCSPHMVRYLIIKNDFMPIWREAKEKRKLKKKKKPFKGRKRMRVTLPILKEFEARGFRVIYGQRVDNCRVEGFGISVFCPKKVYIQNGRRYFIIQSKYLNRLVVIVLPNGRRIFRWPLPARQRYLYIPERELNEPEIWPTRTQFRRQRSIARGESAIKRKKRQNSMVEADYWRLLGFTVEEVRGLDDSSLGADSPKKEIQKENLQLVHESDQDSENDCERLDF